MSDRIRDGGVRKLPDAVYRYVVSDPWLGVLFCAAQLVVLFDLFEQSLDLCVQFRQVGVDGFQTISRSTFK